MPGPSRYGRQVSSRRRREGLRQERRDGSIAAGDGTILESEPIETCPQHAIPSLAVLGPSEGQVGGWWRLVMVGERYVMSEGCLVYLVWRGDEGDEGDDDGQKMR